MGLHTQGLRGPAQQHGGPFFLAGPGVRLPPPSRLPWFPQAPSQEALEGPVEMRWGAGSNQAIAIQDRLF